MNALRLVWQYRRALLLAFIVSFAWWAFEQREGRVEAEDQLSRVRQESQALQRTAAQRQVVVEYIEKEVVRVQTKIKEVQGPCLDRPMPAELIGLLNEPVTYGDALPSIR